MRKSLISLLLTALLAGGPLSASTTDGITQVSTINNQVSSYLANRMPFVNTLGWNDATAASTKLLFVTVGVSGGFAFLDSPSVVTENLSSGVSTTGVPINLSSLPLPYSPTVFGRVGLPILADLDFGLKWGIPIDITAKNMAYKNNSLGGEVRYSVLKQGLLLPGLSIGSGFDWSKGELAYSYNGSLGTLNGQAFSTDFAQKSEWSLTNVHANVRVGMNILLFSIVGGLQVYAPFGDVDTTSTGSVTVGSATESLNVTGSSNTPGVRAKSMLGLFLRLPFFRLGGQWDFDFHNKISAISASVQFVF